MSKWVDSAHENFSVVGQQINVELPNDRQGQCPAIIPPRLDAQRFTRIKRTYVLSQPGSPRRRHRVQWNIRSFRLMVDSKVKEAMPSKTRRSKTWRMRAALPRKRPANPTSASAAALRRSPPTRLRKYRVNRRWHPICLAIIGNTHQYRRLECAAAAVYDPANAGEARYRHDRQRLAPEVAADHWKTTCWLSTACWRIKVRQVTSAAKLWCVAWRRDAVAQRQTPLRHFGAQGVLRNKRIASRNIRRHPPRAMRRLPRSRLR